MITLSNFSHDLTDNGLRLKCDVEIDAKLEEIWFDISGPSDQLALIKPDPAAFLMAMVIPAMERGEDLHVKGTVDAVMLHKLNENVGALLLVVQKNLRHVRFSAEAAVNLARHTSDLGSLTGMSCGIDSLDAFLRFSQPDMPAKYRASKLAIFNVGSFGQDQMAKIAQKRASYSIDKAQKLARAVDVPLFSVTSNCRMFYATSYSKAVTLLNTACALTLADLCDTYLPASSVPYDVLDLTADKDQGLDATDAVLTPLISSDRLEVFCASAANDRFEKSIYLLERNQYLDYLLPCLRLKETNDGQFKNCGTCAKCGHFLLIAEGRGQLEEFADNFDLNAYRKRKWRNAQRIITFAAVAKTNSSNKKVLAHLEESNFNFPFGVRVASRAYAYLHRLLPRVFKVKSWH